MGKVNKLKKKAGSNKDTGIKKALTRAAGLEDEPSPNIGVDTGLEPLPQDAPARGRKSKVAKQEEPELNLELDLDEVEPKPAPKSTPAPTSCVDEEDIAAILNAITLLSTEVKKVLEYMPNLKTKLNAVEKSNEEIRDAIDNLSVEDDDDDDNDEKGQVVEASKGEYANALKVATTWMDACIKKYKNNEDTDYDVTSEPFLASASKKCTGYVLKETGVQIETEELMGMYYKG